MISIFKTIKSRLIVLYIMLVLIVMMLSGSIIILRVRNEQIKTWMSSLSSLRDRIVEDVIESSDSTSEYEEKLVSLQHTFPDTMSNAETYILTPKGNIYASTTGKSYTKNIISSTTVITAMSGTEAYDYGGKLMDSYGVKRWMEYAYPYKSDTGEILSIIYTRTTAENLIQSLSLISETIAMSSVIALAVAAVLGFAFASNLTAPILQLTTKSKELAKGNFDENIVVSGNDEIGQLTDSFNYMATELRLTIANSEREKNKLAALLHNMTDGVLAFDKNGNIIHANNVSFELLEIDNKNIKNFNPIGKVFNLEFENLINNSENTEKEYTIEISDKFISAISTTYANKKNEVEGVILVLQDVTKHKKLDNMRKEFVANVSHEIRTPLTTIKGYTETMLDGEIYNAENSISFLKIIETETDRMAFLAKDLLELSRFDNKQFKMSFSNINLISLIREIMVRNNLLAQKKNQTFTFTYDNDKSNVIADRGRISQVLTNIISNAIKYTIESGTIDISVNEKSNYFFVNITDNGLGIPEEDLGRIFDRFYRVDKARSRAMGGTGLGLSIAKEIMEIHEGKISVTSVLEKGSTFTVQFNKNFGKDLDIFEDIGNYSL